MLIIISSFIITFNSKLLGIDISIQESICLIGYSIFPFFFALILRLFIPGQLSKISEILCSVAAFYLGRKQLNSLALKNKRMLVIYPLFLFYLTLSLSILNSM